MDVLQEAKDKAKQVRDAALTENDKFEAAIDPWLVTWAKQRYSGWLACGFGVGLLLIGFIAGQLF
ncbi:hypothetical protein SAMN05216428_10168 [Nitrosospira sp. Nsp11]|uniref:hypothetical protein n=1 Tax=Nitrosospira sp. Nsp11 TaxID=1855338 RepID=UPI0009123294|nr:hypothetical protein [Nitrosospira sp. Nsp11]SHL09899.1 hypothetical protein SAMN05216428_10168 [Nitrosospira sp. Nsp11]